MNLKSILKLAVVAGAFSLHASNPLEAISSQDLLQELGRRLAVNNNGNTSAQDAQASAVSLADFQALTARVSAPEALFGRVAALEARGGSAANLGQDNVSANATTPASVAHNAQQLLNPDEVIARFAATVFDKIAPAIDALTSGDGDQLFASGRCFPCDIIVGGVATHLHDDTTGSFKKILQMFFEQLNNRYALMGMAPAATAALMIPTTDADALETSVKGAFKEVVASFMRGLSITYAMPSHHILNDVLQIPYPVHFGDGSGSELHPAMVTANEFAEYLSSFL